MAAMSTKPAPPKVAYHPNVRCRRGAGCPCGEGPVIVGPMYRVGEVCVCEGAASEEEKKANDPVEPATICNIATGWLVKPLEGFDLRGWEAADIQGLPRGADGRLDLWGAILCGVDLKWADLQLDNFSKAQLQGAKLPKVAYHPDVRCRRGDGCTCGVGPVIVGPMYRVGEVCVCEGAASVEEKANGPVEPAEDDDYRPMQGFDLRGWEAADIQGLKGTNGKLDLKGAILCGVSLRKAGLQGADLCGAQLQGVNLHEAQLQGAFLYKARLQGAYLFKAHLQGVELAQAQLQGADLSSADLSVLPKGFLLPKQGSAGETEATKEDRSTNLTRANLSVLPKGSNYLYADSVDPFPRHATWSVKVSDAVRHVNLTEANASGAIFTGLDLSDAILIGTTLKGAALKRVTFGTHHPPERPASAALHESWLAKAVVTSVAREALVAADEDDDDEGSSGESEDEDEDEDENQVECNVEKVLDDCMDKLATAAKTFVHKVVDMVDEVELKLKESLLKSSQGDADSILAELLCRDLKQAPTRDKQVVISGTLSKHVVFPLFEKHLPGVLDEALSKPTEARAAEWELLKEFEFFALSSGKAVLLKRLSPIVSKLAATVVSISKDPTVRDEEEGLLSGARTTEKAFACFVQELWKTIRASLEAQVRDAIVSCARAPLERAGKSVRRMAERLNKLEVDLSTRFTNKSNGLLKRFGLVSGGRSGFRSRLFKATLTAVTQYQVRVAGFSGSFDMVRLAWTCSRAKLTKHENELVYLKEELKTLKEMTTSDQTWRDVTETWQATLGLLKSIEVERGSAVLQCIASDEKLLKAIGTAKALYDIDGDAPVEVVRRLNDSAGAHIRKHAYKYDKLLSQELVRIQRVKDIQWRAVTLTASAVVATMIGTANLFSRLYYNVLESEDVMDSERWLLAVLFPVCAVAGLLLLLLSCFGCYHHRWLVQGARRLCGAPQHLREKYAAWAEKRKAGAEKKARVLPVTEAAAKAEAEAEQEVAKAEEEAEDMSA